MYVYEHQFRHILLAVKYIVVHGEHWSPQCEVSSPGLNKWARLMNLDYLFKASLFDSLDKRQVQTTAAGLSPSHLIDHGYKEQVSSH